MADYLNNFQTADAYPSFTQAGGIAPNATIFLPDIATDQIVYDVGNNPVFMRVFQFTPDGLGFTLEDHEQLITAGLGYILSNVAGAMWRSANAGQPAQLIGKRYLKADQKLQPGLAFTGTIQPSGGLQPPPQPQTPLVQGKHNGGAPIGPETNLNVVDQTAPAQGSGIPGHSWTFVDNVAGSSLDLTPVMTAVTLIPTSGYAEFTAQVVVNAGTTSQLVALPSITFDGVTTYEFSMFVPDVGAAAAFDATLFLADGGTSIGTLTEIITNTTNERMSPGTLIRRFIPTAGAHTYSFRCTAGAGSAVNCNAGAGGNGVLMPGFIRCRRDV